MVINTKHFGELQIPEENIITFQDGIPGFIEYTKYVLINDEDEKSPFCWLQSIEEPALTFALINPFLVHKDYHPTLPTDQIEKLGEKVQEHYSILAIVNVPEDIEKITANLMAPIIINLKTKKGMQIILDSDKYPVKYYLFEHIQNKSK